MKKKRTIAIMILAACITLTACTADHGQTTNRLSETNDTSEQIQAATESQTSSESTSQQSIPTEIQKEENTENTVAIPMPILDEINQKVQTGTAGSYMTAVQAAVKLLDWGTGTGLDTQEIKDATVSWLMNKGNDEQVAFAEKLKKVDDAYHKLLGADAQKLLEEAFFLS